ncbi:MAG: tRNA preQ1(34) S-adenosylmethionine ribosyltransferase-isomerase QueA [Oscillospiraceae bacterium]|jgi:S-adenosylmethionine:tRNA ribosyltransferase-isomerase|nr:tRNA preQ1(34) S-adenosylmethionine ribosyltransferase-isomerase QueA [Oscillospiraceae bacterium]
MKTSDFDYYLPPELVAQVPLPRRDSSRLMTLGREDGKISHRGFSELTDILRPGDALILNDSRVIPARLSGEKIPTGGAIEFLLLTQRGDGVWEILTRPGRKAKPGARFSFGGGLMVGEILEVLPDGNRLARFEQEGDFFSALDSIGEMPLPHYITRALDDAERYQTVYAKERGSAAAPTAGLHFTPGLLEALRQKGIETGFVTLHVGLGTFRPVVAEEISGHYMHMERYTLPRETAELINRAKGRGGRVIAAGSTACRTVESAAERHGEIIPCSGETGLFLYPGGESRFRVLDGLLTNFHLPKSTLIMLVAAFAGYEGTMSAYKEAVKERYRFFSFGDAMLIL